MHREGLSSSVCQVMAEVTQASTTKVYQQCWKEWAGWYVQKGVPNDVISVPKLADFVVHPFRVELGWHMIGGDHSAISGFWNHISIIKVHTILSDLNL